MSFNLLSACRQYYIDNVGANPKDVNLHNVRLQVQADKVTWEEIEPITAKTGAQRQVEVTRKSTDVFGQVQTSKESSLFATVSLDKGVVKGYNSKLDLPLPQKVHSYLGNKVSIHISEAKSSSPIDTMTLAVTSGPESISGASASATVTCKEGHFKGRFACEVKASGPVVFIENNSTSEVALSEVAQYVQNARVSGKNVFWDMSGTCEFTWDFQQKVDWN